MYLGLFLRWLPPRAHIKLAQGSVTRNPGPSSAAACGAALRETESERASELTALVADLAAELVERAGELGLSELDQALADIGRVLVGPRVPVHHEE